MLIQVKPTIGPDESVTGSFKLTSIPGVTSSGTEFVFSYDKDTWYVFDESLTSYVEYTGSPYDYLENLDTQKIGSFEALIDNLLHDASISYGYSSIENAISYYNSGVTAWRNEAIAFNTWRDNTETLMYDNIFSFTADGITLPDLAGFTGQTGYFDVGITASRPNLFS